jgi:prepilin-type N-terminal cleavage/methylation domain-containing protein
MERAVEWGGWRAGCSLVEVMIAMVILCVGLLGLQALALAAGASAGRAERTTRSTLLATTLMESTMFLLVQDSLPPTHACETPGGWRLNVAVEEGDAGREAWVLVSATDPVAAQGPPLVLPAFRRSPEPLLPAGVDVCP